MFELSWENCVIMLPFANEKIAANVYWHDNFHNFWHISNCYQVAKISLEQVIMLSKFISGK